MSANGLIFLGLASILLLAAGYLVRSFAVKQKLAEEALQGSERRLQVAIEAARIGTWDSNLVTGELVWSDAAEFIFGLDRGSFEGTREAFYEMVHADDRGVIRRAVNRAVEAGIDFDVEHRTLWPDGSIRWMESKGRVLRDSGGKSVHLMGTVMDITERKQAEQMERIDQELRLASEIQQEFLPGCPPRIDGFELGGHSHPSGQIGGDFYDFLPLSDGRVSVAVGDAAGKGVPGALLIAKAQGVLRAQAEHVEQISDVISTLNQLLCRDNRRSRFVTLFYAVLDGESQSLAYVNAGHPPALLFSKGRVMKLSSTGPPLGMFSDAA
jgi:PAS domain S-box-containing protein